MGGELALAGLVVREHGVVVGVLEQRVVDVCLIKCHPKNVELSRRHEPVRLLWPTSSSVERELLVVREILSGAGAVSQILAGRKDGCRSERMGSAKRAAIAGPRHTSSRDGGKGDGASGCCRRRGRRRRGQRPARRAVSRVRG